MEKRRIILTHGKGHSAPAVLRFMEKLGHWQAKVLSVKQSEDGTQAWEVELTRDATSYLIARKIEVIERRGILASLREIVKQRIVKSAESAFTTTQVLIGIGLINITILTGIVLVARWLLPN